MAERQRSRRGEELNQALEGARRVADFLEFAELMCFDALHRNESCGGHFREEFQTPDGEALRDDAHFSYVAAWEYAGAGKQPILNKESLGCGACVAACPNGAAALFTGAKISHLSLLPQGQPERYTRVLNMVAQVKEELFGSCTNIGECEAVCPKEIRLEVIARMNRDYLKASWTASGDKAPEEE